MGKRYFIVCYNFCLYTQYGSGCVTIDTDNCYINRKTTINDMSKGLDGAKIVITNIIELSEKDYETWIRGEEDDNV